MARGTSAPKKLRVHIGGYTGDSYSLETSRGRLKYQAFGYGHELRETLTLHPSHDDWQVFLQTLDDLDVWNWRSDYQNPGILDGTGWGVEIRWGSKTIVSAGSNSYPESKSLPPGNVSSDFDRFLAAVSKLIGGKPFA